MKSSNVTEKMNPEHFALMCECTQLWHEFNNLNLESKETGFEYKRAKKHLETLLERAESAYLESCEKNGYENNIYLY